MDLRGTEKGVERILFVTRTTGTSKKQASGSEVRFVVYGDPIPKARPRFGQGRAHTTKRTKTQEEKIALVYAGAYGDFCFGEKIPLRLVADFYIKIAKSDTKTVKAGKLSGEIRPTPRPDADNLLKCVQDALNGLAYHDDSQIVEVVARKWYSDAPRTEVYIARLDDDQ